MRIVLTTCPKNESEKIRKGVLKEKLAACVLIIPMKESKFLWEGKIDCGEESLLVFKTREGLVEKLFQRIKKLHPHDIPFIGEVDVKRVNEDYEKWLDEVLA